MLEFFKQPGIYECVLFLAGALVYKLMASMLGIIQFYRFIRAMYMNCFTMIMIVFASIVRGLERKRKVLIESNVDEKEITNVLEQDLRELDTWKDATLQTLYDFSPTVFRDIFKEMGEDQRGDK